MNLKTLEIKQKCCVNHTYSIAYNDQANKTKTKTFKVDNRISLVRENMTIRLTIQRELQIHYATYLTLHALPDQYKNQVYIYFQLI